jgi:predicted negative regulator of RcsB-dependent stress response
MAKWLNLAVRVLIAVVLGVYMMRMAATSGTFGPFIAVLYGVVLFLLFGVSFIQRVGKQASQLYMPGDENFQVPPQYSVAEARVKEGKYREAVAEYRQVIEKFPADVYAHVRISELAIEHLHDLELAETELLAAQAKAVQEDAVALTAHRLADLYQHQLNSPQRGLDVLLSVQGRLTSTKHVKLTGERIESLRQFADGCQVPQPPKDIQLRKSRYRMHD